MMQFFDLFAEFDAAGVLRTPQGENDFNGLAWHNHPTFDGVALKHIVTGAETGGKFSFHLVKIAPNCSIGRHVHETQLETHEVIAGFGRCTNDGKTLDYAPGVISIFPAGAPHEVKAGSDGLYLFAKFMPALI